MYHLFQISTAVYLRVPPTEVWKPYFSTVDGYAVVLDGFGIKNKGSTQKISPVPQNAWKLEKGLGTTEGPQG